MNAALALAFVLVAVQPADAHCFKVWKYPTPQRCGVRAHVQAPRRSVFTAAAVQKPTDASGGKKSLALPSSSLPKYTERVNIEITVTPELLETWARQDALDKIKGELK